MSGALSGRPLLARLAARRLPGTVPLEEDLTERNNLLLLIQLRWMAVAGQIVTIALVPLLFGIDLPLLPMAAVLAALVSLNLVSWWRLRSKVRVTHAELFGTLLFDVAALTTQLYLTGGASNPFAFLYLLQVTLGAVLLEAWSTLVLVAFAGLAFSGLTVFYRPLGRFETHDPELFRLHIWGMVVCFLLDAALLVVFVTRIMRNVRQRDARLADLRQRAAEEDHIVRMGFLASGAAHELGTPLATLSIILGDWRRMPRLTGDPELRQEIDQMQAEVQRCKAIVTGILVSAGETRGESAGVTTMQAFLSDVVEDWRTARGAPNFVYANRFGDDMPIVSDSTLKQVIFNVLDNALEASPNYVGMSAAREGDMLVLTVIDEGPGFLPEMLAQIGKPYQSSKGRPGGGLGLFLVANVLRKLGGRLNARNREAGGASVTLSLPLAALSMEARPSHG